VRAERLGTVVAATRDQSPGRILRGMALADRLRHACLYAAQHPLLWVARAHRSTLGRAKRVVAITGSFGKTTTTRAVTAVLGLRENAWTTAGLNYFSIVPLQLLRQTAFGSTAVIEVGIGAPGQMRGYARALRPDLAILTSLGTEHLASFRDFDHLRAEKLELARGVSRGGTVLLNQDDPEVARAAGCLSARACVVTYGFSADADVRATATRAEGAGGQTITAVVHGEPVEVRIALVGRTAVHAVLAALAVAVEEGIAPGQAAQRLSALRASPGRLEPVSIGNGVTALCDHYKAPLESHETALLALAEIPATRRWAVFGEINSPPDHHACYRRVGALAAQVVDRLVLVGVHSSRAKDYRKGALANVMADGDIREVRDSAEAGELLRRELCRGDVVLVKGRSDQRLIRSILVASGQTVRCRIQRCPLALAECRSCPLC
jgi:UDP-N-acetylmuramoyl-tripeptide--D-alanyl-D-alanine ligase